jgi:hypothetical protein
LLDQKKERLDPSSFGNVDDRIALNVTLSEGIYLLAGPAAAALGEPVSTRSRRLAPAGWRSSEDEAHVAEHLCALGYFE